MEEVCLLMKKNILNVIVALCFSIIVSVIIIFFFTVNNNMIKIAIYPSSMYPSSEGMSQTYYMEISQVGNLIVEYGHSMSDNLFHKPFIQKKIYDNNKNILIEYEREERKLPSNLTNKIYNIVNTIYDEDTYILPEVADSWDIQILYKGEVVMQDCFVNTQPSVKELLDILISISPIEIDLHGWS